MCVLADHSTGVIFTQYKFGWDVVAFVTTVTDVGKVFISGRTTGAASTNSEVANCVIEPVQLTCSVKSFLNTNFLGASFSPLTSMIVYVGKSSNYATATILDTTGVSKERNYYYVAPGMASIALLRAVSPPSFIGTFVAGTGVAGASTNRIIAGWIRLHTGDLTAMFLVPSRATISNSANLVTSMTLEPTGPDSFIAGALELSGSVHTGTWGYIVRTNTLYSTVQYGVRYVPLARRRLAASSPQSRGVITGLARVGNVLFIIMDFKEANVTALSVIKADSATGAIIKQATISSHNASIACTDIAAAALLLDITCTVQRGGSTSQQAQLISVDRELSFTRLPAGFQRGGNDTFTAESVAFTANNLPNTKQSTLISTTDSTLVVSNQMPTLQPSASPTFTPSAEPTSVPSAQPSSSPTSAPSVSPQPTSHPSTSGPTGTHKPSREPTIRPTASPTVTNTVRPSKVPTIGPSARPTTTPSSARPSTAPSASPTLAPSLIPTVKPTMPQPTRRPSVAPSAEPTFQSRADDEVNSSGTQPFVIAVSVMGSVLLVGVCAFLFYKRHELRVKGVHSKFFKVAPNSDTGNAPPMWLTDEAPDVVMLPGTGDNASEQNSIRSFFSGAGAFMDARSPIRSNSQSALLLSAEGSTPSDRHLSHSRSFSNDALRSTSEDSIPRMRSNSPRSRFQSYSMSDRATPVAMLDALRNSSSSSSSSESESDNDSADSSSASSSEGSSGDLSSYVISDRSSPRSSMRSSFDATSTGMRSRGSSFHTNGLRSRNSSFHANAGLHHESARLRGSSFHAARRRFASSFDSVYEEIIRTKGEDAV